MDRFNKEHNEPFGSGLLCSIPTFSLTMECHRLTLWCAMRCDDSPPLLWYRGKVALWINNRLNWLDLTDLSTDQPISGRQRDRWWMDLPPSPRLPKIVIVFHCIAFHCVAFHSISFHLIPYRSIHPILTAPKSAHSFPDDKTTTVPLHCEFIYSSIHPSIKHALLNFAINDMEGYRSSCASLLSRILSCSIFCKFSSPRILFLFKRTCKHPNTNTNTQTNTQTNMQTHTMLYGHC